MIKPEYTGDGTLVLEPTYKHIILLDLDEWGNSIVLDDGLFLACESTLKQKQSEERHFLCICRWRRILQPWAKRNWSCVHRI